MALVNLCVGAAFLDGVAIANSMLMGIFSVSAVARSLHLQRTLAYLPQTGLSFPAYQVLMTQVPWPQGAQPAQRLSLEPPHQTARIG